MPKELNTITEEVMGKIREGKIKARPKIYFVLGSVLAFLGLASSLAISVFLLGLLRFLLRAHGPMGDYRFEQILSAFPLWLPFLAILGLVTGLWLLKRYDFSYKVDFKFIIAGALLAVFAAGIILDVAGMNDAWVRRGPMRGMMQKYLPAEGAPMHRQWSDI